MSSKTKDLITKKDLRQISWRALQGATSVNYERFVHKPLTWQVGPALRKIWGDDPEKHAAALQRHLAFFLCTPQVKSWMGGLMVGLECELKDNPDMDPDSINAVKTSLMGPLSGVFDSLFLNCIRIVACAVGISFAAQGSILGPILYALIYNVPAFMMYFGTAELGFNMGTSAVTKLQESGLINKVLEAASMLGLILVGGMCYTNIGVNTAITFGPPEALTSLNDLINGIFPGALGFGTFFLYYWLMKKKKVNTLWLVFGTLAACIVFTALGIM